MNTKHILNLVLVILFIGFNIKNPYARTEPIPHKIEVSSDILDLVEFLIDPITDGFKVYWVGSRINYNAMYKLEVSEAGKAFRTLQVAKATKRIYNYTHTTDSEYCKYRISILVDNEVLSTHTFATNSYK